jgi:cob(I)alamin adenosyltransferase
VKIEMAFRQNTNQVHKQFLKSSQQELLELGVPIRTLDYDAWTYLLEHGSCFYTSWSVDNLNTKQVARLLELVEKYEGNYSPILKGILKGRIEKG